MQKRSITIFYPSKRIGGAQVLFLRIAEQLLKDGDYGINIIDFSNGYIYSQLRDQSDKFEFYDINFKKDIKISNTIFFTSANLLLTLKGFLNIKGSNLLLYVIQPQNLITIYSPWRLLKKKNMYEPGVMVRFFYKNLYTNMRRFLNNAIQKNALLFMDENNKFFHSHFYNLLPYESFLPIPVAIPKEASATKKVPTNIINIGTISRVENEKLPYLQNLIEFVSFNKEKFRLTIIGDGADEKKIQLFAQRLNATNVSFTGRIPNGHSLDSYLMKHIDLGVAMGTSVLEFAKLKIPVLMTGPFFKSKDTVKYVWFFETSCYDLSFWDKYDTNHFALSELVHLNRFTLKDYAIKCYDKVAMDFNWEVIYKQLLNSLLENRLDFREGIMISNMYNNQFLTSLKNRFKNL